MDIVNLLIQLGSGVVGGNATGGIARSLSLGAVGNSIAGLIGGGLGSQILNSLLGITSAAVVTSATGEPDIGAIVAQVAGGGIGGGLMTMLVGVLKEIFQPAPRRS